MSGISRYGILWRKILHKPLVAVFQRTLKHRVKIVRNDFVSGKSAIIYAMAHVFYGDVLPLLSCIHGNAYVLASNKNYLSKSINGLALFLNGVVWVDRENKASRTQSFLEMKKVLSLGGNVILAPEGTRNLSPNLLIQKMSWSIIDLARETRANIVPVAVDIVNEEYCVIIGAGIDCEIYADKPEAINLLRDTLASLRWEFMLMKPALNRSEISDLYWKNHIEREREAALWKGGGEKYVYRPKGDINLGEVLAEMHGMEYRSMAADYEQYKKVDNLIENWTNPIKFK